MPNPPPAGPQPDHTFETAIERLESIIEAMEGDKLPLEQLIDRYQEGSTLVKVCQDKLEAAERRLEIITRSATGKPQVAEFEPPTAATASSPVAGTPSSQPHTVRTTTVEIDEVSLF